MTCITYGRGLGPLTLLHDEAGKGRDDNIADGVIA